MNLFSRSNKQKNGFRYQIVVLALLIVAAAFVMFTFYGYFSFVSSREVASDLISADNRKSIEKVFLADCGKCNCSLDCKTGDVPICPAVRNFNSRHVDVVTESHEEIELIRVLRKKIADYNELDVPALIKSFRAANIDWHDLVRPFPESNNADYNWERLVRSEIDITNMITWRKDPYVRNHGPLTRFSMCRSVRDKCMIHDKGDCLRNSFCGWCSSLELCIDVRNKVSEHTLRPLCPEKLETRTINNHCSSGYFKFDSAGSKQRQTNSNGCDLIINEPFNTPHPDPDAQSMYYHWFTNFFNNFLASMTPYLKNRDIHLLHQLKSSQFEEFFGLISRFCVRDVRFEIPENTCFCESTNINDFANVPLNSKISDKNIDFSAPKFPLVSNPILHQNYMLPVEIVSSTSDFIISSLGFAGDKLKFGPGGLHPRICFISRSRKRFILNEHELVTAGARMGIIVERLALEDMSLFDQVNAVRQCAMLIGVHGSGIVNFMYLRENSIALQVMPLNIEPNEGDFLKMYASTSKSEWRQWENDKLKQAVLHWHFADETTKNDRDSIDNLLKHKQNQHRDKSLFFTYWLNQDTIIPVEVFKTWVEAVKKKFKYFPSDELIQKINAE